MAVKYDIEKTTDPRKGRIPLALVLARSYNDSNTNGGVAYANANNDASNSNSNYGSRLKFRNITRMRLLMRDVSRCQSAGECALPLGKKENTRKHCVVGSFSKHIDF